MNLDNMDIDDFQRRWRLAKRAFDLANQEKLRKETRGIRLSAEELARWHEARTEFRAVEKMWDLMYQAGVVVVVGDGDDIVGDGPLV